MSNCQYGAKEKQFMESEASKKIRTLENEIDKLERKLRIANDMNFELFEKCQKLTRTINLMIEKEHAEYSKGA